MDSSLKRIKKDLKYVSKVHNEKQMPNDGEINLSLQSNVKVQDIISSK